jgi:GTP-binding protein Era
MGAIGDVDLILFVVEAGSFTLADAKVLSLFKPGIPTLLVANKLDMVHRRAELAPWLKSMQERHPFAEFVPMSAKNKGDIERLFGICEKYLPEQPWWYAEDELTDRSEKFLARDRARKAVSLHGRRAALHLHRGHRQVRRRAQQAAQALGAHCRHHRGRARRPQGHGDWRQGRAPQAHRHRSAPGAGKAHGRQGVPGVWVKVRSGWADDEARVRSFGYE